MIPLFKVHSPANIGEKIEKVFSSGFIGEGSYTEEFENKFSSLIGTNDSVLVNSGTSALSLAYHMCDIKPGDEVITSPMTCMATNEPLALMGANLIWADIDPKTGNICPKDVANKITDKTKAIVSVHWGGQPFDVDSLMGFERKVLVENYPAVYMEHIPVVEDAAHGLGGFYKGKSLGTVGDFGCFSFQAIKHLTTGDGGALHIKNSSLNDRAKKLRWFGIDRNYVGCKWDQDIKECGFKYHMNNINAVIGLEQLKYIDGIIKKHKENSKYYDDNIENPKVEKLFRPEWSESACWLYSILVDNIEEFQKHMQSNGIASDRVHLRNDNYSVFSKFKRDDLNGVDEFTNHMINIPVGWWLSDEDRIKIVESVNSYR